MVSAQPSTAIVAGGPRCSRRRTRAPQPNRGPSPTRSTRTGTVAGRPPIDGQRPTSRPTRRPRRAWTAARWRNLDGAVVGMLSRSAGRATDRPTLARRRRRRSRRSCQAQRRPQRPGQGRPGLPRRPGRLLRRPLHARRSRSSTRCSRVVPSHVQAHEYQRRRSACARPKANPSTRSGSGSAAGAAALVLLALIVLVALVVARRRRAAGPAVTGPPGPSGPSAASAGPSGTAAASPAVAPGPVAGPAAGPTVSNGSAGPRCRTAPWLRLGRPRRPWRRLQRRPRPGQRCRCSGPPVEAQSRPRSPRRPRPPPRSPRRRPPRCRSPNRRRGTHGTRLRRAGRTVQMGPDRPAPALGRAVHAGPGGHPHARAGARRAPPLPPSLRYCPNCGHAAAVGNDTCATCGQPL